MNTKTQKITLAAIAALSFLFISTQGCQKAAERPAKVNSKISNELIDITKVADISSDAKFQPEAQANNSILLDKAISKITDENLKTELMQLKFRGQLVFKIDAVQNKIILIKVMNSTEVKEEDIRGKTYYTLTALKSSRVSQTISETNHEINSEQVNEKVFLKTELHSGRISATGASITNVETTMTASGPMITSLELTPTSSTTVATSTTATTSETNEVAQESAEPLFIEMAAVGFKSGVLEHEKTDYNEKKSILNLEERPLNESTHIILTEVVELNKI